MECELCDKKTYTIKNVEGLDICIPCQKDMGVYIDYSEISGFPRRILKTRANVHMNGRPAALPRPYGQLPGNGSY